MRLSQSRFALRMQTMIPLEEGMISRAKRVMNE